MSYLSMAAFGQIVALRKESVDRNNDTPRKKKINPTVALRKESVDRNYIIKITRTAPRRVALRKESVDRNNPPIKPAKIGVNRRSPQGERG